jgi:transposase-like protein
MKRWSLRETKDEVAEVLHVFVSHVTIWNWCMKFISVLLLWASLIDIDYEKIWHVDEKFIKVRGSKGDFAYAFMIIDSKNKILAIYVADSRSANSAKIVLRKARKKDSPEIIVTDGLQGYKSACKIFGRKVRHVVAHFEAQGIVHKGKMIKLSNNRIERVNGDIDLFLHVFRGLKSFRTAEIWLAGFMIYHNYLKPSRIQWHTIPKMITSRREVILENYFLSGIITF